MSTHSVLVPPPSKPRMYRTETEYARTASAKNACLARRFQKNSGLAVAGTYNPLRDADSYCRPCHCRGVPAGGYGAGDAVPAAVARCSRLFFGRADGALVGAGVFDCRYGDIDADDYRDACDFVCREPDILAAGFWVFDWTGADCLTAFARLLSWRVFHRVCGDRKTIWREDAVGGGDYVSCDA